MKKTFLILLFLSAFYSTYASTIEVGKNKPFSQIKPALESAEDGDTILVYPGHYAEGNIIIEKKVAFIGIDYPVIDGEFKDEVISIAADSVIFKGFVVKNSGKSSMNDPCGIKLYDSRWVRVEDNILEDNFFAIYLQYSLNCVVKNNRITAHGEDEHNIGNGIHCWKSDSIQIIGNYIEGQRDGIYFEFVKASLVWRNISKNNVRYGLHFMFSHKNTYISNVFDNNGAGIAVMYTNHVFMANNLFKGSTGDAAFGLLLKDLSDSEIIGNVFENNSTAMLFDGANRVKFHRNTIRNNGWGMKIMASCVDNFVFENNYVKNTFDVSTNGSLVLTTFERNYWDRYEGYDLDKDGIGDVPYRPLSLFSYIIEKNPIAMLLFRSFITTLMDRTERLMPSVTPELFKDETPAIKIYNYD